MNFFNKNSFSIFLILLFTSNISNAQTKAELQSAVNRLSHIVTYQDQEEIEQDIFAEFAYLKRTYQLDSCDVRVNRYIDTLNDYYYKRFFLYSKFYNVNAIVTEDCIEDTNIAKFHPLRKIMFYSIYPNTVKLPKNIIEQFDIYSKEDPFYGPYLALNTIYFLKKYNGQNLSKNQVVDLDKVEKDLCNQLYTKYVLNNNQWNYYKFLSLKVLKMNNFEPTQSTDISMLITYINSGAPIELSEIDRNDIELMNRVGGKSVFHSSLCAAMWIILTDLNKK
ncbi:MAG TPA: hypothetical protein PLJ42_06465 [Chitinophagales bacterium]|jgi:hypothetical protein|nr:hypothetical protein [Chitinophagales bacterium]MBP6154838.1 hypothetical protein [Chitinophagales bacterium]HQV78549.1 hypothetical protein [Chitinophagales bacterium]HQW79065.1 hypothetical protein [Chitinophagales bacterium]